MRGSRNKVTYAITYHDKDKFSKVLKYGALKQGNACIVGNNNNNNNNNNNYYYYYYYYYYYNRSSVFIVCNCYS